MAGRLGGKRVTQVGLVVHEVDAENKLLLVKGAVPGPKNAIVEVREEKAHAGRAKKAPLLDAAGKESKQVRSTTPSSAPRSSRTSSTRPCAPS